MFLCGMKLLLLFLFFNDIEGHGRGDPPLSWPIQFEKAFAEPLKGEF